MSDNNNEAKPLKADGDAAEKRLFKPEAPLQDDKQRLLQLIIGQGILHDTGQHPIVARDGKTPLSWVMNFLAISLQAEQLQLAARQMLKLLETFEGRQLATIGTAAVPLLSACVLESAGKYSGLMVRAKRKAYGTASLIDGRIDHAEPVIVVDDSIGSGTNMLDCIDKLEQAGLFVEGCACLVRFGYDSGYAKLLARGYRVVALFDSLLDISPSHPADWQYNPYPIKSSFSHIVWDDARFVDYLSPFRVIRESIRHFWQTEKLLKPPRHFNQSLDTSGGIWLSLRAQDILYTSQGRHGFWHFPDDTEVSSAALDVSRVAWLFATHLQHDTYREQRLEQCVFGLSLFGTPEACQPGDFDSSRHALALRSTESPWKMGGALPNMPGISSDAHLLHHARFHNTRLFPHEPYQLYRHSVTKLIEPGAEWPYGGVEKTVRSWDEKQAIVGPLAGILLRCVQSWHQQGIWPEAIKAQYIPVQCQWLFLSVYLAGKQLACVGTTPQQSSDLLHLVKTAAKDERWVAVREESDQADEVALYIRLSLLSQDTYLGRAASLTEFSHFVPGQNAIAIQDDKRFALMLPEVPLEQQWSVQQLNDALYKKAGIAQSNGSRAAHWRSYRTVSWHADTESCQRLQAETRLPGPSHVVGTTELMAACRQFLKQHQQADGVINSHYHPVLHQVYQQDTLFNTAFVLSVFGPDKELVEEWQESYRLIEHSLSKEEGGLVEQAYAVLALLIQLPHRPDNKLSIAKLLPVLQGCFDRHGQLARPETETAVDHYGIELYVLLRALAAGFYLDTRLLQKGVKHLVRYAERQATPRQYPVLLQTFALLKSMAADGHIAADPQLDDIIAQLVQDLLQWQQPAGAFLPETPQLSPVLCTIRALHAMLDVSMVSGESLASGLHYLKQQLIQPAHRPYFPVPDYAIGGVYSGLLDGCLSIATSAQLLRLLGRIDEWRAVDESGE